MTERYYLDTSIWMDLHEDRIGFRREPIGEYALQLFAKIRLGRSTLVISDFLIKELQTNYTIEQINGMIFPFKDIIEKVLSTKKQVAEASRVSHKRNLPKGDIMHAIICRDANLILVSRDKYFKRLLDICECYKPEDLI